MIAALAWPSLSGCGVQDAPLRPDVLLVTFDTLRADHCSAYGYERATTPALDRLAAAGIRFRQAYAPTATTAPSHASLFTGRDPLDHGVRRNGSPLEDSAHTVAEILAEAGYATAGFASSFVVNRAFGFAQGFEHYDDDFSELAAAGARSRSLRASGRGREWHGVEIPAGVFRRSARDTTERALAWIEETRRAARGPVFVWVHYIDPHEPYEVPSNAGDPFAAESLAPASLAQIVARYDTLIWLADRELGRLIDRAERSRNPDGVLTIVTSDHGEAFLEHGWRSHGVQIYEESLRVPLVMHWPDRLAPARIEEPVSLHDLLPTLRSLLGIEIDTAEHAGRDLSAALRSRHPIERVPVVVQRQAYASDGLVEAIPLRDLGGRIFGGGVEVRGEMFGVRAGRWKYIEALDEPLARQLYDLERDPGERANLSEREPERVAQLSGLLASWQVRHRRARTGAGPEISPHDSARLRALGYADPGAEPPTDPAREPGGLPHAE